MAIDTPREGTDKSSVHRAMAKIESRERTARWGYDGVPRGRAEPRGSRRIFGAQIPSRPGRPQFPPRIELSINLIGGRLIHERGVYS
jgi:hypothetical protein